MRIWAILGMGRRPVCWQQWAKLTVPQVEVGEADCIDLWTCYLNASYRLGCTRVTNGAWISKYRFISHSCHLSGACVTLHIFTLGSLLTQQPTWDIAGHCGRGGKKSMHLEVSTWSVTCHFCPYIIGQSKLYHQVQCQWGEEAYSSPHGRKVYTGIISL